MAIAWHVLVYRLALEALSSGYQQARMGALDVFNWAWNGFGITGLSWSAKEGEGVLWSVSAFKLHQLAQA